LDLWRGMIFADGTAMYAAAAKVFGY
jgi:hypothetical protein